MYMYTLHLLSGFDSGVLKMLSAESEIPAMLKRGYGFYFPLPHLRSNRLCLFGRSKI